jgi:hypothetical protein
MGKEFLSHEAFSRTDFVRCTRGLPSTRNNSLWVQIQNSILQFVSPQKIVRPFAAEVLVVWSREARNARRNQSRSRDHITVIHLLFAQFFALCHLSVWLVGRLVCRYVVPKYVTKFWMLFPKSLPVNSGISKTGHCGSLPNSYWSFIIIHLFGTT